MNKYLTRIFLCGLSSSSLLFSDQSSYDSNSSTKVDSANYHMITPSASPIAKNGSGFFFDADFIYWTAREEGLAFAGFNSNSDSSEASDNSAIPQKQSLYLNGKYSPGFKAGIGIISDHDGWDLYLQYTWYKTTPTSSTYSGSGLLYTPELSPATGFSNTPPYAEGFPGAAERVVNSSWNFRFTNFDLELGRNFFVSSSLAIRPHFGLKGGWQRQRFAIDWQFNDVENSFITWTNATYQQYLKQKQWNVGLRTGIDTSWILTKNWSFYGDLALAGVWTSFKVTEIDTCTTTGSSDSASNVSNFQTYNQGSEFKVISPVLELVLGIRFDWWFSNDDYRFRLQAGWENQTWFNQNNFGEVVTTQQIFNTNGTNLTLQGLTLEVRFDF